MRIAGRVAGIIFDDPKQEQIETVSRMIRYGAHLALFFVVGLVTAFVSMVIFRGYFRIVGIILAGLACYMMAYYTEYYKQYVEGRHFQNDRMSHSTGTDAWRAFSVWSDLIF